MYTRHSWKSFSEVILVTDNSTPESVTSEPKQVKPSNPSKLPGERLSVEATIGLEWNFNKLLFRSKCFLNCIAIITQRDIKTGKYDNSNWNVQARMSKGHEKLFRDILFLFTSKAEQSLILNSLNESTRFSKRNSCK